MWYLRETRHGDAIGAWLSSQRVDVVVGEGDGGGGGGRGGISVQKVSGAAAPPRMEAAHMTSHVSDVT